MPTLVRDRFTWLTYAQLGTYGFFLYGFGPSVPLLRDDLGVSNAVSGLHGTALAAGSALAGLAFARLVRRVGRARVLRAGLLGLCVGVGTYCLGPVLPVTLAGALLCGLSGSFVVTGSVVVLGARHGPAGYAAISEANAGAAGAGLLSPLLIGAGVSAGIGWRPGLLATAVAAGAVWVLSVRTARADARADSEPAAALAGEPAGEPARGPEPVVGPVGDRGGDEPGRLPGRYWLAWVVLVLCIGVEFCLVFWAADSLREHSGASPAAATAGITAVVAGMFAGRLAGGWVALRVRPAPLLLGALGVTLAGFAVFWLSTPTAAALAGLVLCGVGVALQYPVGAARAVAASGNRPDRAAAKMSLAAGLASGVAPFGLGAAADRVGSHTAFLIVPVLIVGAAAFILASRDLSKPQV